MHEQEKHKGSEYPIGRGYGNDYMRGGEVFGGYGYSERPEYEKRRGEMKDQQPQSSQDQPISH
jgi:hypothetical protein